MTNRARFIMCTGILMAGLCLGLASPATAANRFAVVDAAGGLIVGSGVAGVTKFPGSGRYEVTFTANVSLCAYVATTANLSVQALQVYTAGGHLSPNGVYVETKNQGGGLTDGLFHLVVDCGGSGFRYAVVGYAADLVRATPYTTLTYLGVGQYHVTFSASVAKCAYLATVGDPANQLVFNPSGVYTASGPDNRTVLVETKNPGGGLQDGVPFHLAVICAATKSRVAVVDAAGIIKRGSPLTSAFRAADGRYVVATNMNVNPGPGCATVATRGSVDQGVPFTPATIELQAGPAANTWGLQVRELLAFDPGGNGRFINEAFHSATVCK